MRPTMARRYVLKCSAVGAAVARVAVVLLASTWALLASAAEPKEKAPAQTGETFRWGYVGARRFFLRPSSLLPHRQTRTGTFVRSITSAAVVPYLSWLKMPLR